MNVARVEARLVHVRVVIALGALVRAGALGRRGLRTSASDSDSVSCEQMGTGALCVHLEVGDVRAEHHGVVRGAAQAAEVKRAFRRGRAVCSAEPVALGLEHVVHELNSVMDHAMNLRHAPTRAPVSHPRTR